MTSKISVAVRMAKSRAAQMHAEINKLVGDAVRQGAAGSGRLQIMKMKIAEDHYRNACLDVIRAVGGNSDGLETALQDLATEFVFAEPRSGAFRNQPTAPHLDQTAALRSIRDNVLEELHHDLIDTNEKTGSTTNIINQSGNNSVASASGSHSTSSVNVTYSKLLELAPAAIHEARNLAIDDNQRDLIIDHIQSIEDEAKKPTPDEGRVKRLLNRLSGDVSTMKDAAIASGGAALATHAVDAFLAFFNGV